MRQTPSQNTANSTAGRSRKILKNVLASAAGAGCSVLCFHFLFSHAVSPSRFDRFIASMTQRGVQQIDVRTRVSGEIKDLSVALESYKADHGYYPTAPRSTQNLDAQAAVDPTLYIPASRFLYRELSGDGDGDPSTTSPSDKKRYFKFPPEMLRSFGSRRNTYIADQWGNSFGYSTFKSAHPKDIGGYNFVFDLWSTGGGKTEQDKERWSSNW